MSKLDCLLFSCCRFSKLDCIWWTTVGSFSFSCSFLFLNIKSTISNFQTLRKRNCKLPNFTGICQRQSSEQLNGLNAPRLSPSRQRHKALRMALLDSSTAVNSSGRRLREAEGFYLKTTPKTESVTQITRNDLQYRPYKRNSTDVNDCFFATPL